MRIDDPETPNSLARVGGVSLLQRTLRVLAQAGVREVGVALGWHGQKLRDALAEEAATVRALGVTLSFFDNPTWQGPNGLSVLAARAFVLERTLLVMADQIAAPALVAKLCRLPAAGDKTILVRRSRSGAGVRHRRRDEGEAARQHRGGDRQAAQRRRRRQRGAVRHVAHPAGRAGHARHAVADRRRGRSPPIGAWSRRTTWIGNCGKTSIRPRCATTPSGCCASTATSWRARRGRAADVASARTRWRSSSACSPRKISPDTCC